MVKRSVDNRSNVVDLLLTMTLKINLRIRGREFSFNKLKSGACVHVTSHIYGLYSSTIHVHVAFDQRMAIIPSVI